MNKPELLWVNLTVSLKEAEFPTGFRDYFEIRSCNDPYMLDDLLDRRLPLAACFDFDYPDRTGLQLLRATKQNFTSLPLLMLTLQHSESLAIWAFRSKVWDYLVKPLPRREIDRCSRSLLEIRSFGKSQQHRSPAIRGITLPDEISDRPRKGDPALAPAIYFIEKNFRTKIRSEDVAKICGMSPFRFSRAFKDSLGSTFRDYLLDFRLKEACRLLENPTIAVTDVAYAVGFNDASYFARVFKQRIGIPPSTMVGQKNIGAKRVEGDDPDIDIPDIVS
ncbi:MAG TPA: helix-turn-helix domain-containing protein [Gammaproteobacteria bacterium]